MRYIQHTFKFQVGRFNFVLGRNPRDALLWSCRLAEKESGSRKRLEEVGMHSEFCFGSCVLSGTASAGTAQRKGLAPADLHLNCDSASSCPCARAFTSLSVFSHL